MLLLSWEEKITDDEWLHLKILKAGTQNYTHLSQFMEPWVPAKVVFQAVFVNSGLWQAAGQDK